MPHVRFEVAFEVARLTPDLVPDDTIVRLDRARV
jgi:hypothetical protein